MKITTKKINGEYDLPLINMLNNLQTAGVGLKQTGDGKYQFVYANRDCEIDVNQYSKDKTIAYSVKDAKTNKWKKIVVGVIGIMTLLKLLNFITASPPPEDKELRKQYNMERMRPSLLSRIF